jgi:hypothetical protein
MKNDKLIPGLVLVLIGLAFLLDNFGYINFHWMNILHLWPIFLIIAGVNLVFVHNNTPIAYVAKIGVIILGFGLLLFGNFGDRYNWPWYSYSWHDYNHNHNRNNNDSDDDDDDDDDDTTGVKSIVKVAGSSNFVLPYSADAKTAELHISGGGTQYNLTDTTNQLFKADTKEHFSSYELSHSNAGPNYVLNFDMKQKNGGHFNWGSDDNKNAVNFELNNKPVWSIYVEAGAAGIDFDLSKYQVQKLKLSGGAASFKVKLGQPLASTDVEVSTGMASVNISIPQNAACEIETDSGLSSNNFDGFTKTDDGHYQTPGFANAKNKIHINIDGGMSDFKVNRY